MADANGSCPHVSNCYVIHTKTPCTLFTGNGECFFDLDFDKTSRESAKTPEEKLADRERELSALKDTCREIKSDLQVLMREVKGFALLAEHDVFDRIIRESKNSLDEVLALERRKIPELEAMLAKNIYRCSIFELLSEQLTK